MTLTVSLNEVESTARKAFRGAGYHWGEAEEGGKAAVWMARHGLAVAEPILTVLHAAKNNLSAMRPVPSMPLRGQGGTLCPLLVGIMIADGALRTEAGKALAIEGLLSPVLLLPFLSLAAADGGVTLSLSWNGGHASLQGAETAVVMSDNSANGPAAAILSVTKEAVFMAAALSASRHILEVDSAAWDALNAFAAETYVPATARSRIAGAGAGLADND